MLQVHSDQGLARIETSLRRAAARHDASVMAFHDFSHVLGAEGGGALSFAVCLPDLYAALLAADIRISAFLPCRIAAYPAGGGVTMVTISPFEFCRLLNRADLAQFAGPLETALLGIMEDAAAETATTARAGAGRHAGGLGATEEQVNMRGSIPQRIDCRGTKVEDLGGTGGHDAQGG